ncbi:MAG: hypothetical protein MUE36_00555 [Acidimicrobiales bacterium]|jgi:hypothetical protein|nr:hypothetical protein [Acidimicrobiales bacterium]
MGKASSSKKVARAARAGAQTGAGAERNLVFPLSIAAILVVGVLVVVVARGANQEVAAESPRVGEHWHAAYGIYVCDAFLPPLTDVGADTTGLHTHDDGVAHIHPFANGSAGRNATFGTFGEMVGLTFDSDSFTVNGTTYANGFDCNGQPAEVSMHVWPADDPAAPARILTEDFASFRFDEDRLAVTLAVVPAGTEVPRPESVPELDSLSDVPGSGDPTATPSTVTPSAEVPATTAPTGGP